MGRGTSRRLVAVRASPRRCRPCRRTGGGPTAWPRARSTLACPTGEAPTPPLASVFRRDGTRRSRRTRCAGHRHLHRLHDVVTTGPSIDDDTNGAEYGQCPQDGGILLSQRRPQHFIWRGFVPAVSIDYRPAMTDCPGTSPPRRRLHLHRAEARRRLPSSPSPAAGHVRRRMHRHGSRPGVGHKRHENCRRKIPRARRHEACKSQRRGYRQRQRCHHREPRWYPKGIEARQLDEPPVGRPLEEGHAGESRHGSQTHQPAHQRRGDIERQCRTGVERLRNTPREQHRRYQPCQRNRHRLAKAAACDRDRAELTAHGPTTIVTIVAMANTVVIPAKSHQSRRGLRGLDSIRDSRIAITTAASTINTATRPGYDSCSAPIFGRNRQSAVSADAVANESTSPLKSRISL